MAWFKKMKREYFYRTAVFLFLSFFPLSVFAYNKSWDQGHECVNPSGGQTGWGKFDYNGVFQGGYTSKECCELLCKICPVYANTGQFQKTFTDLTLPGAGPALTLTRTYLSQSWASTLLGHGWVFNFGKQLIIIRNKAGERIIGVRQETGETNFFKDNGGSYQLLSEYGVPYELSKNGDNYIIKNRDGSSHELNADGKIITITDKNANKLNFEYNAVGCLSKITNASGNYVEFQLGPNGKIASISDNLGRTIHYNYAQNGNLTSSIDPLGNATQYIYDSNNRLAQIIDPLGNTVYSMTYTNVQPPKIATLTEKGETYTISYYNDHTLKTDSQGNAWTYYFNNLGIIERVIDPLGNIVNRSHNRVTSTSLDWEEDANGNRTTYTYDAAGNITSKTNPLNNTWAYTYVTGTNRIATEANPLGVVTKYDYDAAGNLVRLTRDYHGSLENITTYTYDSRGNQTRVTDPLGHTTAYEYDANGNLTKITDALGNVTTYTYDNRGNKLTETDANGNTTAYAYDLLNRLLSITDALGNTTVYTYDANSNNLSETDANGNPRTFTYDAYNRLTQETDSLDNTTSYAYDARDNRISMTDANGNTTAYTYDILNHLTRTTDALGGQTNYTYDRNGNNLTITDANGNTTTFAYDAAGRRISEVNSAGERTSYSYDANGNQITVTLPNGNIITRTYDSLNHIISIRDIVGTLQTYTYNAAGQVVSESNALGNVVSTVYDANNRIIQQADPLGNNTVYTYDAAGNVIIITDRNGNAVNYTYDALRRKISTVDQLSHTSVFAYGKTGVLLSVTDANGNRTSYTYDKSNRLIQETYADAATRSFAYDAVGNIVTRTDQKGQVTTYLYDNLNRRLKVDYPGTNDNEYTYDAQGNLLTANNQDATLSFSYDTAYRLNQSVQNGKAVGYSYDIAHNTRTITYPGGKVVKEITNPRGSLARVEDSGGQAIVQYTYDAADRIQTKNYANGITTDFTNNANGWITTMDYKKNAASIFGFQYGFDKEGNRLYAGKTNDVSNSEQYSYDTMNRLIQFKRGALDGNGNIPAPVTQTAYNLDSLGNWISKDADGVIENRTHNAMNEIAAINGGAYSYDSNGNLVDDGAKTYEYDYENRLLKVSRKSGGGVLGEYRYDTLGRRISKQAAGTGISYYYDNARVIEEQSGGVTSATYTYGNDLDEVLTMERGGQSYYYHANSLGSIVALSDTSGGIVEQYTYNVYGQPNIFDDSGVLLLSSAVNNRYLFTGGEFDGESGLQFNRNRYLSYRMGRWISQDPIGYKDSLNLYEYVQNNPINFIDPTGLWYTPAEVFLATYFYRYLISPITAWLLPDYVDISQWSSVYRRDQSVVEQVESAHEKIRSETRRLADILTRGQAQAYLDNSRNAVYVTSIYSFGGGYLNASISCAIEGIGCGASANCLLNFSTRDVYQDPIDLHQYHHFPEWFANVGGVPFSFGLSWQESFAYTYNKSR